MGVSRFLVGLVALNLVSGAMACSSGGGDDDDDTVNPCGGVSCSSHGTCAVTGGNPICACDEGYRADGLSCVPVGGDGDADADGDADVPACQGVTCSSHGTCAVSGGSPICACDDGYHAEGLSCVVNEGATCSDVDCPPHSTCNEVDLECYCDAGYVPNEDATACVPDWDRTACEGYGGYWAADGRGGSACWFAGGEGDSCDAACGDAGLQCDPGNWDDSADSAICTHLTGQPHSDINTPDCGTGAPYYFVGGGGCYDRGDDAACQRRNGTPAADQDCARLQSEAIRICVCTP